MSYDAPMYVTNYTQTRQLPFKVAMDDGSAAKQFGNVRLTPTTFLVDKDGKILKALRRRAAVRGTRSVAGEGAATRPKAAAQAEGKPNPGHATASSNYKRRRSHLPAFLFHLSHRPWPRGHTA